MDERVPIADYNKLEAELTAARARIAELDEILLPLIDFGQSEEGKKILGLSVGESIAEGILKRLQDSQPDTVLKMAHDYVVATWGQGGVVYIYNEIAKLAVAQARALVEAAK